MFSLAPAGYNSEINGPRREPGRQRLRVSPKETCESELHLSALSRYPRCVEVEQTLHGFSDSRLIFNDRVVSSLTG